MDTKKGQEYKNVIKAQSQLIQTHSDLIQSIIQSQEKQAKINEELLNGLTLTNELTQLVRSNLNYAVKAIAIIIAVFYYQNSIFSFINSYFSYGIYLWEKTSIDSKLHILYIAPLSGLLGYFGNKIRSKLFKKDRPDK